MSRFYFDFWSAWPFKRKPKPPERGLVVVGPSDGDSIGDVYSAFMDVIPCFGKGPDVETRAYNKLLDAYRTLGKDYLTRVKLTGARMMLDDMDLLAGGGFV